MVKEKHEEEAQNLQAQAEEAPFTKQEVIKEDGRRLIFYTFPDTDVKDKD